MGQTAAQHEIEIIESGRGKLLLQPFEHPGISGVLIGIHADVTLQQLFKRVLDLCGVKSGGQFDGKTAVFAGGMGDFWSQEKINKAILVKAGQGGPIHARGYAVGLGVDFVVQ